MLLLPEMIVSPVALLFLNTKFAWFCALADKCNTVPDPELNPLAVINKLPDIDSTDGLLNVLPPPLPVATVVNVNTLLPFVVRTCPFVPSTVGYVKSCIVVPLPDMVIAPPALRSIVPVFLP